MKIFSSLPILTILICLKQLNAQAADKTPFCNTCECTYEADKPPDVDCSKVDIKNYIYEPTYWFIDGNASTPYPIRSLNLQNQTLRDLTTEFPASGLKKLDLSHNNIVTIAHMVFCQLQELEVLDLSYNDISILDGESFRGVRIDGRDYPLTSMVELHLDNNKMRGLEQDLFEHLDMLKVLDLSNNPLTVIDAPSHIAIVSLPLLEVLDLSFTGISKLPENFLHTPKNLITFNLTGNQFTEVPQSLGQAQSLQEFYFDRNPIQNLTSENGFPTIATLKKLCLCYMPRLSSIGKGALSKLENLEELHITHNLNLSEIDPAALSRRDEGTETEIWPPIKKLHLDNNKLASIDYHLTIKWDSLIELDLRYNAWTCECENQWMVDQLMPAYIKINETMAQEITCAAPIELKGQTFYELYGRKSQLRCLDLYGNRPEKDATILVGILAGLLIGIPIILALMYLYQRHCFNLFDKSPAAFSRQFYSRASTEDVNF